MKKIKSIGSAFILSLVLISLSSCNQMKTCLCTITYPEDIQDEEYREIDISKDRNCWDEDYTFDYFGLTGEVKCR